MSDMQVETSSFEEAILQCCSTTDNLIELSGNCALAFAIVRTAKSA